MEEKLLTPLQLWNDYNPTADPLKISFRSYNDEEDYKHFEAYFNGSTYSDGVTRIFIEGYVSKHDTSDVLIIVGDYSPIEKMDIIIQEGFRTYSIFFLDYIGKYGNNSKHTIYPESISYANYLNAGSHLTKATPTAQDTCVFIWTKVCRRAISFVKQLCGESSNVALMGIRNGADIAWQATATDSRVKALVVVDNAGWKEFKDIPKYGGSEYSKEYSLDDETQRWLMASAAQSYAKLVKCPTLYVGGSNCDLSSIDRIESTLGAIVDSETNVRKHICASRSNSIDEYAMNTVYSWLDMIKSKQPVPKDPIVTTSIDDNNQLIAELAIDKIEDVSELAIYYNFDEMDSSLRNWNKIILSLANRKCVIPVYEGSHALFVYGSVLYKEGYGLSSYEVYRDISADKISYATLRPSHIIFEKKNGLSGWVVEEDNQKIKFMRPELVTGGLDIVGLSASNGNLSTYTIGGLQYKSQEFNLLQFDVYSPIEQKASIGIVVEEKGLKIRYIATYHTQAGKWTKCSFEVQDFKTVNMLPLKSWDGAKKLTLYNVETLTFNNIIWV